jgi:hypothetical protein
MFAVRDAAVDDLIRARATQSHAGCDRIAARRSARGLLLVVPMLSWSPKEESMKNAKKSVRKETRKIKSTATSSTTKQLSDDQLDKVSGGVAQAGWNLARNRRTE